MNRIKSKKQWGGRFVKETDPLFEKFSSSISYDRKLARFDIQGSIAHTLMLVKCGVIDKVSGNKMVKGLHDVQKDIEQGKIQWNDSLEDIHTHIEVALKKKIGALADKLHTARSRNDQVALDLRLYLKEESLAITSKLSQLQETLWEKAQIYKDTIVPAYTHLRRAQPVLFAHYLLAYVEMFERDKERMQDLYKRLDVLPLGSCALAGTSIKIDRYYVAKQLGFQNVSENSMDAVSDRDFAVEVLSAIAMIGVHLSRISEDILIWSSDEFAYVRLPQSFCSGSSAMPHKMNPDLPELLRGKGARLIGNLVQILCMLKGLPLTYNRDLQEDKESVFDSVESITKMLEVFSAFVGKLKLNKNLLKESLQDDYTWALDFAEYLVKKGLDFRSSHELVGKIVLVCEKEKKNIGDFTLSQMRSFSPLIGKDFKKFSDPAYLIACKQSLGSTSPQQVEKQLVKWKRRLGI